MEEIDVNCKSVLISIRPNWCAKIANEEKTVEVRKNRPKIQTPFKCYIYCTLFGNVIWRNGTPCNGKVMGEFICDEIITDVRGENTDILCNYGCLSFDELKQYGGNKTLYGWHISELKIYGKPIELSELGLARPPQSWCYVNK